MQLPKGFKIMIIFLIVALCIAFIIGIYALCVNAYMVNSTKDKILTPEESAELSDVDCILVLGAGVHGTTLSHMLEDRVKTGIGIYELGSAPKILMSGDHGRTEYDEVNNMKQFAIDRNIPSEDIFMDHAGFSTYDSMYRARDIFGCKKIIIVTQEYHLYRALYVAESLGIEAYGVAADSRKYVGQWTRDIREVAARTKDFFMVAFDMGPVVLGDAIPISGNGNLTNG
jgi:vancomycin permeability regulator SanA